MSLMNTPTSSLATPSASWNGKSPETLTSLLLSIVTTESQDLISRLIPFLAVSILTLSISKGIVITPITRGPRIFLRLSARAHEAPVPVPPPSPAKITDSRYKAYADQWGTDSWELDALDPSVLSDLVENKIKSYVSSFKWTKIERKKTKEKRLLGECSDRWEEVVGMLEP